MPTLVAFEGDQSASEARPWDSGEVGEHWQRWQHRGLAETADRAPDDVQVRFRPVQVLPLDRDERDGVDRPAVQRRYQEPAAGDRGRERGRPAQLSPCSLT